MTDTSQLEGICSGLGAATALDVGILDFVLPFKHHIPITLKIQSQDGRGVERKKIQSQSLGPPSLNVNHGNRGSGTLGIQLPPVW